MIITDPNAMVAEVHDRMPVVLEPDNFTPWLEREVGLEIAACGRGHPSALAGVKASKQLEGAEGR